ncbi:nucleoside triphosphatase YtkD [Bacillaceae bacterium SIJ1]|uniref:RNA deprotection pyrophosphohydrolase n=1 Tax=Litoribacterium kuwaitense TaxID=1398745 RepID=UPI0013ED9B69|nr:nucleoside triphosphatase YtkD [Litoribacterium kuwaitense]NGP44231.1 nucleoside triphosphatase YtkD [Litoribacterium kuwaitense]
MHIFEDYYHNKVRLSFQDHPFSRAPGHVLVLTRYNQHWLLTKHPRRGIEFPGGKVEPGELPRDAASREVYEETGGVVSSLSYIGQYKVDGKQESIEKNIYYATVSVLEETDHYYETEGPVLFKDLPEKIKKDARFSFHMKDDVVQLSLRHIQMLFH